MKQRTITSYTIEADGIELPVSHRMPDYGPEAIYTFNEDQTKFIIVYAMHDLYCDNPLEDCDGMGRMLLRGHYGRDEAEMLKALGLDQYGNEDLTLIPDTIIRHELNRALTGAGRPDWEELVAFLGIEDKVTWANEDTVAYELSRSLILEELAQCVATGGYLDYLEGIWECLNHDTSLTMMWEVSRADGLIGDPFAVGLDVYDHSGTHWSISGGGMQCMWDTSSGAGVWVPDGCAREEAEHRAKVYAKGRVLCTKGLMKGPDRYYAVTDTGVNSDMNLSWHEAYTWLESQDVPATPKSKRLGRIRAAEELAQQALDQYNAWSRGDCWGVIVEELELVDGEWRQVSEDSCWGYVGSDYAEDVMREEFESRVAAYQVQTA